MSYLDPIDWIHRFEPGELEVHHLHQSKRCLLDLIGVAAAATRTELAGIAARYVRTQHGGGRPLLFTPGSASETGAALHGAWLIDAFDAHDGQVLTKGHAGVAVLPGLLAHAETERLSGHEFLGLLTLGYEVATRAGIALHATACDYHTSGAWNAIAVAALSSKLLDLDRRRLHEAMGIAEFYGPRSQMMRCIDHPTMVKDGSGWGAMGGVAASLLARDGFTGAPAVTVLDEAVADIWNDLGRRWYLHEQYFKAYPVCRWAQPAVESILSLRNSIGHSGRIARIDVHTFHEGACLATANPATTEAAQYSLPWPVACAAASGRVDAASVTRLLADPDLKALARRVHVHRHDDYDAKFPAERWAHATVTLDDGRVLASGPCEARGNPTNPFSDTEIETKYRQLTEPVLGKRADPLLEIVMTLEQRPASDLLPWLGAAE
ncbi:MAG: 2-methylcitrate dehydratase [Salinicola sp.]|uniref:MmgE/PrpD family protein n=1 Tax=uncultured Salinicola sp. TaxID=1193542 RepID=UPI000C894D67|nr:MmgE/PrpD family protein [uncultured Salinicola sp.]MAM56572.1 2-methylcitrate dehydratase [Salinicola sp.]